MFEFKKFKLQTKKPLPLPNGELQVREGYYVIWKGHKAELSPLTSLSGESLKLAFEELQDYENLLNSLPEIDSINWSKPFLGHELKLPLYNSVLFCLESLLMAKYYNHAGKINVNTLISCNENEKFQSLYKKGYKTFKIKIAKYDFELETKFLDSLPSDIKLRLDANQNLNKKLLNYLEDSHFVEQIEYLEEPFKELEEYKQLTIPFALDESRHKWEYFKGSSLLKAIISKPSIKDSISGTYKLAKELSEQNIKVVVSSAYDSPVALNYLSALANLINNDFSPCTHGLDGLDYYKEVNNSSLSINGQVLSYDLSNI
ncbi:MAG: hypothetical protein KC493_15395 [Bacteriovoracaceae bacterium]|nr:hypothetical protein [Bacteriovoracaceae bacterium]